MPKLPIPVPPPGEIDRDDEPQLRFVIPAQRRPTTPSAAALRGIAAHWLLPADPAAPPPHHPRKAA